MKCTEHQICRSSFFAALLGILFLVLPCSAQEQLSGAQSDTLDAGIYEVIDDIWVNSQDTWEIMPGEHRY
jgi:hypothetical protein